jgi:hypothetical protein
MLGLYLVIELARCFCCKPCSHKHALGIDALLIEVYTKQHFSDTAKNLAAQTFAQVNVTRLCQQPFETIFLGLIWFCKFNSYCLPSPCLFTKKMCLHLMPQFYFQIPKTQNLCKK